LNFQDKVGIDQNNQVIQAKRKGECLFSLVKIYIQECPFLCDLSKIKLNSSKFNQKLQPVIPALGRLRQVDGALEANLGYTVKI
jgi:hypothetical protein